MPCRGRPAACRCRAGSRCRRRSARSAPGPSNRCQGCSCRPTDRRADETFGHRDEIGPHWSMPPTCCRGRYQPSRVTAKAPSSRTTVSVVPITSVSTGGNLIEGPGKAKVRSAVTLWVGAARGLCQRAIGKPADIAVAVELAPGPAFAVAVVDRDALALQRLRQQLGIGGRRAAQRRDARRQSRTPRRRQSAPPRSCLRDISRRGRVAPASGGDHP